jgi:chromosome partitioning protein
MGRVIAIVNQKGGVGKTTTAVNLSAGLAMNNRSTLMIDMDPQCSGTSGLGIRLTSTEASTYDVLLGNSTADRALRRTMLPKLQVIGASQDLIGAEIELVQLENRESRLRDALATLRYRYDFIIMDCPPSLGLVTLNALTACDALLIPLQCEYYALEGLSSLLSTVSLVRDNLNESLAIDGLILTMFDGRNTLCRQVADDVKTHFPDKVFDAVVPRNVRLSESPSHGLPALLYDPSSKGAQAYAAIAKELIGRLEGASEGASKDAHSSNENEAVASSPSAAGTSAPDAGASRETDPPSESQDLNRTSAQDPDPTPEPLSDEASTNPSESSNEGSEKAVAASASGSNETVKTELKN